MVEDQNQIRPDELIDVMRHRRRRQVVAYLQSADTAVFDRDGIARAIAGPERESTARADDTLSQITLVLHHQHLPKMEQAGLIDYDPDDGTVRRRWEPDREGGVVAEVLGATVDPGCTAEP